MIWILKICWNQTIQHYIQCKTPNMTGIYLSWICKGIFSALNLFWFAAVLEDLYSRRDDLNHQIKQEEDEKERLQHDFQVLNDKLRRVTETLSQRIAARAAFNRTITETEAAYTKVCFCPMSIITCDSFYLLLPMPRHFRKYNLIP